MEGRKEEGKKKGEERKRKGKKKDGWKERMKIGGRKRKQKDR